MGIVELFMFGSTEGHKANYGATWPGDGISKSAIDKLEAAHGSTDGIRTMPIKIDKYVEKENDVRALSVGTALDPTVDGESEVLRYPASPGIRSDSDYVLMTFFEYLPPAQQGQRTGGIEYETKESLGVNKDKNSQDYLRETIVTTKYQANYLNVYNNTATGDGASNYKRTDAKQIMLYMPEDISTGYKANWNGKAISTAGRDLMRSAAQAGFGNKISGFGDTMNGMFDRVGATWSANTVRGAISSITGDTLTNDEVFGAIGGIVTNPNTELLFNNMDMRTFQLKWKLVPRNAKESQQVKDIINTLKKSMLPGTGVKEVFEISEGSGVNAGFISIPDLVRVSFMNGSGPADYLPQFKMCAITQVDINYTPDGSYAKTVDANGKVGGVVAMELTVGFQETKLIYREEVQNY